METTKRNTFSLEGRWALVTGGARGLGLGMARALARAGANLVIVSRTESQLREAAGLIAAESGREVRHVAGDLSAPDGPARLFEAVLGQAPGIDILVNNAGVNVRKSFLEMTAADFDKVVGVNLRAVFLFTQQAARHMIDRGRGGRIVNVCSLTSILGIHHVSAYAAAKGGLASLTKAWAVELAPHGIQVNAVAPGYFRTELTEAAFKDEARLKWMISRTPLGRTGEPEDLGDVVVFLAAPASNYLTGTITFVDGGWTSA